MAAVLVLNTPDVGRLRPKYVEWLCRNKTCTVLHQVGVSFDPFYYILVSAFLANSLLAYVCSSWNFCQEFTTLKWNFIECNWLLSRMMLRKKRRVYNCRFPPQLLEVVSQSDVFLYPLLLPPQPFRCDGFAKPFYFPSEDLWVNSQFIL